MVPSASWRVIVVVVAVICGVQALTGDGGVVPLEPEESFGVQGDEYSNQDLADISGEQDVDEDDLGESEEDEDEGKAQAKASNKAGKGGKKSAKKVKKTSYKGGAMSKEEAHAVGHQEEAQAVSIHKKAAKRDKAGKGGKKVKKTSNKGGANGKSGKKKKWDGKTKDKAGAWLFHDKPARPDGIPSLLKAAWKKN